MAKPRVEREAELSPWPLTIFVLAAPFFAGMFYEPYSALASLFLLGWLLWCRKRRGSLTIRRCPALIAVSATVLFYLFSALWAADHGMAPLGFVKFLPLPLFLMACGQLRPEQRRGLLRYLPETAAGMTVLAALLGLIPALRGSFYVNHRLAGFFEYPNTFALYALLGVLLMTERERWRARELLCLAALLCGIALSGSRTVMALLAAAVLLYAVLSKNTRRRVILAAAFFLMLGAAALYARLSGDTSSAGRYLTTSAGSSTFLGRLLYFRDALPVILRHPFGLGYLGYWYTQGSFQTGVYAVMHIHNDLLQFLLDVGWIPTGLLVWAVVRGFRRGDALRRGMIGVMTAHLLLDFDMQFAAMDLILLVLIDTGEEKTSLRLGKTALRAAAGVLAAVCLYFGAASALYYSGQMRACAALYPGYTPAQTEELAAAQEPAELKRISDAILSHNENVALAWNARARLAYSAGDMAEMMDCKRRAIALDKYTLSEYLDYADMLAVGLRMDTEAGDTASAAVCREELAAIPAMLEQVREGTSALGWRIADAPELDLPADYAWLETLTG